MSYTGSCHCGQIRFDVQGTLDTAMECNCSHCSRKGYLLWFVPRTDFTLRCATESLGTYTFNKHAIQHHFCPRCGCAPFGMGASKGVDMAAINVRCLEGVNLDSVERKFIDGRSY
jgi:hypothetical protein